MRAFDSVILKSKLQEFISESKKNIESKIKKVNSILYLMKEENEIIISKSKQNNQIIFII
mgnify:FL=1